MLSRIEETIRQLPAFREDSRLWECCAYHERVDSEFGRCDANELDRYRFLIALQYQYRPEDEDFVRYLFDQEVIARREDDFQGMGDALRLASYLLSRWKRQSDFWRFAEAKFANFDTYCGYDSQFLLAIGHSESIAEYAACEHELKEDVLKILFNDQGECFYTEAEMTSWQEYLDIYFIKQAEQEPASVWIKRAIIFELYEEGRNLLDQHEASSNASSAQDIMAWRKQLHDWKKAIKIQQELLQLTENDHDRASGLSDLAELLLKDARPDEAWMILRPVEDNLKRIRSWKEIGLGRSVVEVAFRIVKQATKPTAKEAFSWGCRLKSELTHTSLHLLTLATEAAEAVGDQQQVQKFRAAAKAEKSRIEMM